MAARLGIQMVKMKAEQVYKILTKIFDVETPDDDWEFQNTKFLTQKFKDKKNKDMGLMVDNAKTINKVYTATFLNNDVMELLKKRNDTARDSISGLFCFPRP